MPLLLLYPSNVRIFMLRYSSFILLQVHNLWDVVPCGPGDRFLSMLPPWHAYERACEYFMLSFGVEQVYTNVIHLKVFSDSTWYSLETDDENILLRYFSVILKKKTMYLVKKKVNILTLADYTPTLFTCL